MADMAPPAPAQPVTVTILDVYTRQVEMSATLAVMDERLKAIQDHEIRLRVLETLRGKILGAAIAVSALVSAASTGLGIILTRH